MSAIAEVNADLLTKLCDSLQQIFAGVVSFKLDVT